MSKHVPRYFPANLTALIYPDFEGFGYLLQDFTGIRSVCNSHNSTAIETLHEQECELGMERRVFYDFKGAGTAFRANGDCHNE